MTTLRPDEAEPARTTRQSPTSDSTTAGAFTIPTISLTQSRQKIAAALREASLTSGFFQLSDIESYIAPTLVIQMFEQTELFFALPDAEKQKVTKKDHLVGGYEGFRFYDLAKTGDGGKKGKDEGKGGWNEGFAIAPEWGTNCFPQEDGGDDEGSTRNPAFNATLFQNTCRAYFHAIQELGRNVLGMIAEGLALDRNYFEAYLDKQNSFCRLTHYYRATELAEINSTTDETVATSDRNITEEEGPEVGAAPHTDWGALTLLIQDLVGGLQVFDRAEGKWHDVPPLPLGTGIVCNIGDLLARWTNDRYKSTLHRVLAPKRGVHRYSIPFFNPGNREYLVQTIPSCIAEGEQTRYAPITAGEYITEKHLESTGARKAD